ncbi:ATP-dependent Clp protease adapter ClpS [Halobacteriovorax sp. HLS]|uniref:ATP-dependent Clp protease adapter ClpS n=1 Tax=Halobacteriovorax sp. HLS TaxID=2234000 RepID=UPI0019D4C3D7|nr:ATP-dependent Clp protease adapter ClpS [Halobacteriovorax sp. HLS]
MIEQLLLENLDEFNMRPIFNSGEDEENDGELATIKKIKVKKPKKYKVLIHNDDYTTMEFVVYVLQKIFHKNMDEAQAIMLKVHKEGVGVCGVYSFEIAESKSSKVLREAKENGHPLKCSIEPES